MTPTTQAIAEAIKEAESCLNVPYIWGGNNPLQGLDCSGFVCWVLKRFGLLEPQDDLNAQQIYNRFARGAGVQVPIEPGSILWFGEGKEHITHIAIAISLHRMIESGGGNASTQNLTYATLHGAMVRRSMITRRNDLVASYLPAWPEP